MQGICLASDLPSLAHLGTTLAQLIHGTFTFSSFPLFQGEAHRRLWLLSPLSATGQRPRAKEQRVLLSYASSLPSSARTPSHTCLSPHTGLLSQLTISASKVLPRIPSDVRSSFWGKDTFVTAGRGNEALPGCVPQWDTATTSFCSCFSRPPHQAVFLPLGNIATKWMWKGVAAGSRAHLTLSPWRPKPLTILTWVSWKEEQMQERSLIAHLSNSVQECKTFGVCELQSKSGCGCFKSNGDTSSIV